MKLALRALILLSLASTAFAADPAGEKALHDYVLTMPKVKAYAAATEALQAASAKNAALKTEVDSDNGASDTLAQQVAIYERHPKVYAFYSAQGLGKQEAVLVGQAVQGACSVAAYPQLAAKMAATVSPSQVAFCKANLPELRKMKALGIE